MAFRVGQKVACVDASGTNFQNIPELTKGEIYTIRWIGDGLVKLVEPLLRNEHGSDEPLYARRFRPVVKRKTDISVLQALLVPSAKIRETV
ncbi:MAG: CAP-Gly domain protein [Pseudomonadota bacterium]